MVHTANYQHLFPGVIKRFSLYGFAPKRRDFLCPLSVLERVRIIEVFHFGGGGGPCMRILSVHRKLSVLVRCPY